jgi:predicted Zn-dependent protease
MKIGQHAALFGLACMTALGAVHFAGANPESFRVRASQETVLYDVSKEDIEAEIAFGRGVAARIFGRFSRYDDETLTRYVNLVGRNLAVHANRPELAFRFVVLATDTVNAYACPGGYIFITRGALEQMSDEAELAGVLAHEIAHITQKHIVKALNIHGEKADAAAGISRILGSIADPTRVAFSQAVDKAVDILFNHGLDKTDEFEADRVGTELLALTGYDPQALDRYLAKIGKQSKVHETISDTHPPFAERVKALDRLILETGLGNIKGARFKERFDEHMG